MDGASFIRAIALGAVAAASAAGIVLLVQRACAPALPVESPQPEAGVTAVPAAPSGRVIDGLPGLVGNTPLIRIKSLSEATGCEILAKAEFMNPGGSSKDRVALQIIRDAAASGALRPGGWLVEGTSGSTGISLALLARAMGYRAHIVMPDDQAAEKALLLRQFGATVQLVKPVSIVNVDHYVNIARRVALEMQRQAAEGAAAPVPSGTGAALPPHDAALMRAIQGSSEDGSALLLPGPGTASPRLEHAAMAAGGSGSPAGAASSTGATVTPGAPGTAGRFNTALTVPPAHPHAHSHGHGHGHAHHPSAASEHQKQLFAPGSAAELVPADGAVAAPSTTAPPSPPAAVSPARHPGAVFCDQFETLSNTRAHYHTTGPEIWAQTGGKVDAFVMGAGTGGTLAGVARYLKERSGGAAKAYLIDPPGSSLYNKVVHGVAYAPQQSERTLKRHRYDTIVEGVGIDRVTANFSAALPHVDGAFQATDRETVEMSRYLLRNDGLFCGSSTALNCVGAVKLARQLGPGHTIVTLLCDSGMRHVSRLWNADYLAPLALTPEAVGTSLDFVAR